MFTTEFISLAQARGLRNVDLVADMGSRLHSLFRKHLPFGIWIVVSDRTISSIVGMRFFKALRRSTIKIYEFLLNDSNADGVPVADESNVNALEGEIRAVGAVAVVAVGSGTINDVAKAASFDTGLPYAIVATAPSMNGYTSSMASITIHGRKVSRLCRPPVSCIADPKVLETAPSRMIAAGFADLMSRAVSQADCVLSHVVTNAPPASDADPLIAESWRMLDGIESGLVGGNGTAIASLFVALCLSGLAMTEVASSAPLSGAEHLISHFLDMVRMSQAGQHEFHGCQVGVATVAMLDLYRYCLRFDASSIDIAATVDSHLTESDYLKKVKRRLGAVMTSRLFPKDESVGESEHSLHKRLQRIKSNWPNLRGRLQDRLQTASEIERRLVAAHCPISFNEIGVDEGLARNALLHAKDVRRRYTVLHLASDIGKLEAWSDSFLSKKR